MRLSSMKSAIIVASLSIGCFGISSAQAGVLGTYTFDGTPGNQTSQPIDTSAAGLSFTNLVRGSGLTPFLAANSFAATDFERNFDINDYFGFTINPTSSVFDVTSIDFTYRRAGAGPDLYSVRTSLDGFTSNIASGSFGSGTVNNRLSVNFGGAVTGVTGPLTVRLYAWHRPIAASGDFRLGNYSVYPSAGPNNFVVNGAVTTTVPEAGTVALVAPVLGIIGMAAVRRRKTA